MSDRHEKWQPVDPDDRIAAWQPYRVEYELDREERTAHEGAKSKDHVVPSYGGDIRWFVDSSWRPPLELPTEPTLGFARNAQSGVVVGGRWRVLKGRFFTDWRTSDWPIDLVADFVPATPEQVARIEGAR